MVSLPYTKIVAHDDDYMHITAAYCQDKHAPLYRIHTRRNDIAQRYELLKLERWNKARHAYECVAEPVENTPYEYEMFLAFYLALGEATTDEQFHAIMRRLRIKPERGSLQIPLAHGHK
ncbi:hypothetical protein JQN58_21355 [Aneurinibacillus sp. BA2021]|nr:hypothetical protein [Aneurinibacillus sp. BA2021]